MEGVVIFLLVMLVILIPTPVLLFSLISKLKANNKFFQEVADSLHLELQKGNLWNNSPEISGNIEGCQVEVKRNSEHQNDAVVIKSKKGLDIPPDIHITRETVLEKMQRKIGIQDIRSGEKRFDDEMQLEAVYKQNLIALLDEKTRRSIMHLSRLSDYFEIKNSKIIVHGGTVARGQAASLVKLVQLVVSVTQNLAQDISIEERFARNIKFDPVPQVRINNIRAMTSHPFLRINFASTLKEALRDSSKGVQVEAAKHLGEEGMNHLVKILENRGKLLHPTLLIDITQILKQKNFSKSIPVLKIIYHATLEDAVKKEILKAFAAFADTDLNSFLLYELEKENPELQLFIIEALGTCGRVDAVEKLYRIGKTKIAPLTRRAVKEAIARIQSRLGDVQKGWLSVNPLQDIDGALSLADDAGEGALSLPDKKPKIPAKK